LVTSFYWLEKEKIELLPGTLKTKGHDSRENWYLSRRNDWDSNDKMDFDGKQSNLVDRIDIRPDKGVGLKVTSNSIYRSAGLTAISG